MDAAKRWTAVLVTLVGVAALTHAATVEEYCRICSDHTMCIYDGVSSDCGEVLVIGVTDEEKTAILDAHNTRRNTVALGDEDRGNPGPQPSASDMLKLKWDDDLATVAQRWAEQCRPSGHDKCRKDPRFSVGQNIHRSYSTMELGATDWDHVVGRWYDEVVYFDGNTVGSFQPNPVYGHYTQVVWAQTSLVGCGQVISKKDDGNYHRVTVCNYGKRGNIGNRPVYAVGSSCSKCPRGCDADYAALCA